MSRINEDIIPKLVAIRGREITYKELCREVGIPYTSSNAKAAQLKDLDMYCQIDRIPNTTKYIISEVYDEAVLRELNGNDKYQAVFEAAIYHMFLDNGDKPLYVSYMDMLKGFNEVNNNFPLLCSAANAEKLGDEYAVMPQIGQPTYKILREWTKRKIDRMNARGVALKRDGFRLYAHKNDSIIMYDVPIDSEEERLCQQVWNRAVNAVMPQGWCGGWVYPDVWEAFEQKVAQLTVTYFNGRYDDLKRIVVLSPPQQSYVKEMLQKLYADYPDIKKINDEVYNKILSSRDKRLLIYSDAEKTKFADIAIKENPQIDIREKLRKNNAGI